MIPSPLRITLLLSWVPLGIDSPFWEPLVLTPPSGMFSLPTVSTCQILPVLQGQTQMPHSKRPRGMSEPGLWSQKAWVQIQVLPVTTLTSDKSLSFPVLLFSYLYNETDSQRVVVRTKWVNTWNALRTVSDGEKLYITTAIHGI